MGQLSKYLRDVAGGGLTWWCQGCKEAHTVWVGAGSGPRWGWNGNVERPVFTPSVLVTGRRLTNKGDAQWQAWHEAGCPKPAPALDAQDTRCHTFIGCNGAQPGEVIFLSDCTHELAGRTLPLAELPPYMSREA